MAPIETDIAATRDKLKALGKQEADRPDYKPEAAPEVPTFNPMDAFKGFGGAITGLLMFAAGRTHTPAAAAASSMAQFVTAYNQHNLTDYEKHYQQWKDKTDEALKLHAAHRAKVTEALDVMTHDATLGKALMDAAHAEAQDATSTLLQEAHLYIEQANLNDLRKRLAMAVEEHRDQIIMNEGKIKAQVAWNSAFDEVKQARANAATNPGALADADAKFALATHDLATATNPMFEAEAAKEAQGKSTVVTDPGNGQQYVYNPITHQSTTLDGKPYTPSGLQKLSAPSAALNKDIDVSTLATAKFQQLHARLPELNNPADQAEMASLRMNERSGLGQKPLSDDAADLQARFYLRTGRIEVGFGQPALRAQIMERAEVIAKSEGKSVDDYLAGRATLKADTASLAAVTKQKNAAEGYERGAVGALDLMVKLIPPTAEPLEMQSLTRWVRTGETQFGDIHVPAWQAQLITSLDQYAKVLTGATGAQGSTDLARALALSLIPVGSTSAQIQAIVPVLKQDMAIKIAGYKSEQDFIVSGIAQPGAASATAPAAGPREGETNTSKSGKPIIFRNGQWEYR